MLTAAAARAECSNRTSICANVHSVQRPAIADYPPGARLPPRVIDDFEFVWMLRGHASLTTGDGDVPLTPGLLLLIPPGLRHAIAWDPTRPSRHGYVHFAPRDIGANPAPELRLRRMTDEDPLAGLCAYLLWLGRGEHDGEHDSGRDGWQGGGQDGWQGQVGRTLRFMLALVESGPLPEAQPSPVLVPPLRAAVAHLRREWSRMPLRRITVEELAAAALVSRGYLNRLFQTGFRLGTAAALERVRCSRAETLLTRTDLTVDAVAHQCGFADVSHFSHRFSKIYGTFPSGYRAVGDQAPSVLDHSGIRRLHRLLWLPGGQRQEQDGRLRPGKPVAPAMEG